ncbi:hypothetical protein RhiirA1_490962 [Rhizophagus irregularis]|uniref:Uncharacterized protein n=4 Tax=Rhizophagus irregularis TaxID=588596 RepID=A0A2N0SAL7_9GLOM|nr:hypothetical protein RhiirA1_490962 [Rhizophagus irregularis]GBC48012.2 hypothetical protein GLOIN_2v1797160 [Rhizophagus irregularis DAOM 181602=DAOM 197198]
MMGLKLGMIDFSASSVNKDRQTQVLFKEIQKANAEKVVTEKVSKSSMVIEGVDEEEVVDVVNRYRKGALQTRYLEKGSVTNGHVTTDEVLNVTKDIRKKEKVGEVPVSEEDLELYNKVNQACSSCLPGIKKEEISGEEIIGHKRCSKEELSRGMVRSDETDRESGSEKTAVTVVKKEKSAQGGKGKKGEKSKKKNKKEGVDTLLADACRLSYDKLLRNNCYNT